MFLLARWALRLFITVVVLGAIAVGADIGSRVLTESQMASAVKHSTGAGSVSVKISSFPFLYHLADRGDVDKIDVVAHNVPVGPLSITQVELVVNGVVIDRNQLLQGREKIDKIDKATASFVYQLSATEAAAAAAAGITAVPGASDTIAFVAGGRTAFTLNLSTVKLLPACAFHEEQTGNTYKFSCSVSPVPPAVLASLSK